MLTPASADSAYAERLAGDWSARFEPARKSPGIEPARAALIRQRIGELKARLAKGGAREAAIRALVYIGLGGAGADECACNELPELRAEHQSPTLQAFKQNGA